MIRTRKRKSVRVSVAPKVELAEITPVRISESKRGKDERYIGKIEEERYMEQTLNTNS